MLILDGKLVAQTRRKQLTERIKAFQAQRHKVPGLAVILVGDDPASAVYVRNKIAACEAVGIRSMEYRLPANATMDQVRRQIQALNQNPEVHGILLQLPLPKPLNSDQLTNLIAPEKDPDGLTSANLGLLLAGRPRSVSCTPFGVMKILEYYKIPIEGRHAVVVGRSQIVGKPMAQLLLAANATVTICHSRTKDLESFTRQGDIVVVAAGQPEFLGKSAFKKDAVVVDVGMHRQNLPDGKTKLVGDVRGAELQGWVSALTPVPGGVGPMTITMLLENTLQLAELS